MHKACRTHCCIWHGCKYGYDDCPVERGDVQQAYACDLCPDQEDFEDAKMVIFQYRWLLYRRMI